MLPQPASSDLAVVWNGHHFFVLVLSSVVQHWSPAILQLLNVYHSPTPEQMKVPYMNFVTFIYLYIYFLCLSFYLSFFFNVPVTFIAQFCCFCLHLVGVSDLKLLDLHQLKYKTPLEQNCKDMDCYLYWFFIMFDPKTAISRDTDPKTAISQDTVLIFVFRTCMSILHIVFASHRES